MSRFVALSLFAILVGTPSTAVAQAYVQGSFCTACAGTGPTNQLYDDGLHGDGAAGDGVFGVSIVVDKPAGMHSWSVTANGLPFLPNCGCEFPGTPARLWTSGPGDVIHFRTGGPPGADWASSGLSCDHGLPPGAGLEVQVLPAPNPFQPPTTVCSAQKAGSIWSCTATFATAGQRMMRFAGPGVAFTRAYNASCACLVGEEGFYWVAFSTSLPDSKVSFEFDEVTGGIRVQVLGPTPLLRSTMGALKTLYR